MRHRPRPIRGALKDADGLILATDPDREGEAIAWQVLIWLQDRDALGDRTVRRVAFHEVTPDAVRTAMERPRGIDMDLVRAQQARRALDYLVGFHLSALLWRKVRGVRSAGRVQSMSLRLICAREAEIEAFEPSEYWTVDPRLAAEGGGPFAARLTRLDGEPLDRTALASEPMAEDAARRTAGIVAWRGHPLLERAVTDADLARCPWVDFDGGANPPPGDPRPSLGSLLEQVYESTHTRMRTIVRAGTTGLFLMATSPYLAWLSLTFLERLPGLAVQPLPVALGRYTYRSGFVARRAAEDLAPFRRFETILRETALGRSG